MDELTAAMEALQGRVASGDLDPWIAGNEFVADFDGPMPPFVHYVVNVEELSTEAHAAFCDPLVMEIIGRALGPDHWLFVMDGAALLEWAATQPGGPEFVDRLQRVAIDQTEPGKRNATGPMVGMSDSGRAMFRRFPEQQPTHDASDPETDWAMIAAWHTLIDDLSLFCPRFKLDSGQAVVIDNYRLFHGRESYSDISRCMWRLWVWTTAAQGVPEGMLHSDSRFAGVTPLSAVCGWSRALRRGLSSARQRRESKPRTPTGHRRIS